MPHPFKRSTLRYGRTPEPTTGFRKPGQTWDTRIGSARVRAKNWRLLAFGCICIASILTGTLTWLVTARTNAPFVIEVDQQGRARNVGIASANYKPSDAQFAFHLAAFIENVRAIPADAIVLRKNWLKAYAFVTDRAAVTLNEYARANDPFAKVGQRTIAVEVKSVVRASIQSFLVRWIERTYDGGALTTTHRFSGVLAVLITLPTTAEKLSQNPLGIYVHAINWSQDLATKDVK